MSIPRDATLSSLRGCSRGGRRRIVNVPLRTREAAPEGNGAALPMCLCEGAKRSAWRRRLARLGATGWANDRQDPKNCRERRASPYKQARKRFSFPTNALFFGGRKMNSI